MFARVITIQTQPGKAMEGVAIYRDSVVPAAQKQRGFKGALLLTDSANNKAISVTLWNTEADRTASEASGYVQEQLAKMGAVMAGAPVREGFEVSVQA